MSSTGTEFTVIAWILRALLLGAVALGAWGVARHRAGPLLVGGLVSLVPVTQTFLMRALLIIPMIEVTLAVGYLVGARRGALLGACGAMIVLYAVQLRPLLGR